MLQLSAILSIVNGHYILPSYTILTVVAQFYGAVNHFNGHFGYVHFCFHLQISGLYNCVNWGLFKLCLII